MHVAPSGLAYVAPSGLAYVAPSGLTYVAPSGLAYVAPMGLSHVAPMGLSHVAPSGLAHVAPCLRASVVYLALDNIHRRTPINNTSLHPLCALCEINDNPTACFIWCYNNANCNL